MAFSGQDGFVWGIGVVEDRFDPQKLGRVRVRWLGYHTADKAKILTKDLPWAQVMQSVSGNAMAGIGEAPVNLVEGTWVCGFFQDTDWMDDAVVIGTLPGMNTTTALTGGNTMSRKWAQYRGEYQEFDQDQSYGETGSEVIKGSDIAYSDYHFGFFDPTYDQSKIPHPPSELSFGSLAASGLSPYIEFDFTSDKLYPRVLNWSPENIQDLVTDPEKLVITSNSGSKEALSEKINPTEWTNTPPLKEAGAASTTRITHSDLLHAMFKTTRRVVSDARLPTSWTKMGTMKWPDTMTYSKEGTEQEPFFRIGELEDNPESSDTTLLTGIIRLAGIDRENFIITTGYLEDGFWRDSTSGMPTYPWIRQKAVVDDANEDSRGSWGQGTNTGQFGQTNESYRVTHPRVKYVQKKNLTPTQSAQAQALYNGGHYGSGIYEMDDPEVGRKDIQWDDVKPDDLVIVKTPDMNPLAMGGIPITGISSNIVTTKAGFFTTSKTSTGANAKPEIAAGDIVQIAGVRGMQEINGRVFEVLAVSGTDSLTIQLGTADGTAWTGPGSTALVTTDFSAYINGGVVVVNPHPVLQYKSDIRERQVNIGSPDPESGLTAKHWNQPTSDFNAQYPFNQVYESESGHIKEFDDTPGGERIHEYHRAGTFYEIDHAGNKVDYVKGDRYDISMHDDYVYVKGRVVHTYDDEVLIRCNDRLDLSSKWKMQIWSGGDLDIHSKRNINLKSDGDINLQADGHINMQGTALTADQAKYKAGTRGVFEMSKIRMKAGHLEAEMVGDVGHPDLMGIALQSNIAPIQIKTVSTGKSIFITSAEDIEMFANTDFYRTAWTGKMWDYAYTGYNLTAVTGNLEIIASGTDNDAADSTDGSVRITAKKYVDIEACTENVLITAGKKEINLYAQDTTDGHIRVKAGKNLFVESLNTMNIKSGEKLLASSVGSMDFGAAGINAISSAATNIVGTTVNLNSGGSAEAPAASEADPATLAEVGSPAYIAQTMTLLVTDLPNPVPSDPPLIDADSHGLALNKNDPVTAGSGVGGENIRNLEDLLADMSSGVVAHTFTPSSNVGAQVWTGTHTVTTGYGPTTVTGTAGIWDGYSDELENDIYVLGKRAFSNIRRFHGWTKEGDTTHVTWSCTSGSSK